MENRIEPMAQKNATPSTASVADRGDLTLPPAPLRVALPLFAVSSLLFFLTFYLLLPVLLRAGVSRFVIFNLILVLPTTVLAIIALAACRFEGVRFTWPTLRDRFRLGKPSLSTWLWAIALAAFMFGGWWSAGVALVVALTGAATENPGAYRYLARWLVGLSLFIACSWVLWQAKPWLSAIQLHQQPHDIKDFLSGFAPTQFMGIPLAGQWWVALYYLVVFMLSNIAGEELLWRGYLLPRQEVVYGRGAWVVNGLLWATFHIFFQWTLWDLVRMVPTCCALAFVAQHRHNTWTAVIGHAFGNAPLLFQIVQGVMG